MNKSFYHQLPAKFYGARRLRLFGLGLVALFGLASGCGDHDAVHVDLRARTAPGVKSAQLEISAQVAGDQTGLHYKWFSVAGGCDPQESFQPLTAFKFADGSTRDRVTVEVWRGNKRVGRGEMDVKLDEVRARLTAIEKLPPGLKMEITKIPPYEPQGGPDTHADIAGQVAGPVAPDYNVVIYARASETWYVQPIAYASHSIHPDNTWSTWTHTGSSYAALLVRPGFEPVPRLDVLPPLGGYVVARVIVDGKQ